MLLDASNNEERTSSIEPLQEGVFADVTVLVSEILFFLTKLQWRISQARYGRLDLKKDLLLIHLFV